MDLLLADMFLVSVASLSVMILICWICSVWLSCHMDVLESSNGQPLRRGSCIQLLFQKTADISNYCRQKRRVSVIKNCHESVYKLMGFFQAQISYALALVTKQSPYWETIAGSPIMSCAVLWSTQAGFLSGQMVIVLLFCSSLLLTKNVFRK